MAFPVCVFVFLLVVCLFLSLAQLWRLDWFSLGPSSSAGGARRTTLHRLWHRPAPQTIAPPVASLAPTRLLWDLCLPLCVPGARSKAAEERPNGSTPKAMPVPISSARTSASPILASTRLLGDGKHGHAERIQTFRGPACRTTFTSRRNTALYRLKTPSHQIAVVLSALAEGLDPSAAERVFGFRQTTITSLSHSRRRACTDRARTLLSSTPDPASATG